MLTAIILLKDVHRKFLVSIMFGPLCTTACTILNSHCARLSHIVLRQRRDLQTNNNSIVLGFCEWKMWEGKAKNANLIVGIHLELNENL
jgi:hypothetical protein